MVAIAAEGLNRNKQGYYMEMSEKEEMDIVWDDQRYDSTETLSPITLTGHARNRRFGVVRDRMSEE